MHIIRYRPLIDGLKLSFLNLLMIFKAEKRDIKGQRWTSGQTSCRWQRGYELYSWPDWKNIGGSDHSAKLIDSKEMDERPFSWAEPPVVWKVALTILHYTTQPLKKTKQHVFWKRTQLYYILCTFYVCRCLLRCWTHECCCFIIICVGVDFYSTDLFVSFVSINDKTTASKSLVCLCLILWLLFA